MDGHLAPVLPNDCGKRIHRRLLVIDRWLEFVRCAGIRERFEPFGSHERAVKVEYDRADHPPPSLRSGFSIGTAS